MDFIVKIQNTLQCNDQHLYHFANTGAQFQGPQTLPFISNVIMAIRGDGVILDSPVLVIACYGFDLCRAIKHLEMNWQTVYKWSQMFFKKKTPKRNNLMQCNTSYDSSCPISIKLFGISYFKMPNNLNKMHHIIAS